MITRRPFFILVSVNATRGADCAASVAAPASAATSASPSRWKWRGIGQPPSEVTAQIIGTTRIVVFSVTTSVTRSGRDEKGTRSLFAPAGPVTLQELDPPEAARPQCARREPRARSVSAVDDQNCVMRGGNLSGAPANLVEWDVDGARHVPGREFLRRPDVKNRGRLAAGNRAGQLVGGHLRTASSPC